jgi:4-hydroxy-3-methylbut-2-enyl diphosphate reductase
VAHLISDETSINPEWITEAEVIGLSSGASTPDVLVERVVAFLSDRGYGDVEEVTVATEDVHFPLPAGLD